MGFQIVPLAMLGAYLLYASYYYATPMFFLKVMLFLAHIRHRDIDIRFVVRAVDEELESRFWPMTACAAFRRLLGDIRKGRLYEAGTASEEDGESGVIHDHSDS